MQTLHIDNREVELIKYFSADKICVEQLEVGDLVIKRSDGSVLYIFERKTVSDLSASICDGRLREQKMRLLGCYKANQIFYIIEGNLMKDKGVRVKGGVDTLLGSITNMLLRDGIHVLRTTSLEETFLLVQKLFKKCAEFKQDEPVEEAPRVEYAHVIKKRRKDNMTPQTILHASLCLVPQISDKIADVICERIKNVGELVDFLKAGGENAFEDFEFVIKNEKKRRIGKVASSRIHEFFVKM